MRLLRTARGLANRLPTTAARGTYRLSVRNTWYACANGARHRHRHGRTDLPLFRLRGVRSETFVLVKLDPSEHPFRNFGRVSAGWIGKRGEPLVAKANMDALTR